MPASARRCRTWARTDSAIPRPPRGVQLPGCAAAAPRARRRATLPQDRRAVSGRGSLLSLHASARPGDGGRGRLALAAGAGLADAIEPQERASGATALRGARPVAPPPRPGLAPQRPPVLCPLW
jgi:hypothetical protein